MEEIWKDIQGYEGLYQISSQGRVRSLDKQVNAKANSKAVKKGKILVPCLNKSNGYLYVSLIKDGKRKSCYIHRLVAIAFIPNEDNLRTVNHRSEIKTDNSIENLEWLSDKDNVNYGTGIKRRAKTHSKRVKCVETGEIFDSCKQAEDVMGIKGVSRCINGKRKTAGGYHWEVMDNGN